MRPSAAGEGGGSSSYQLVLVLVLVQTSTSTGMVRSSSVRTRTGAIMCNNPLPPRRVRIVTRTPAARTRNRKASTLIVASSMRSATTDEACPHPPAAAVDGTPASCTTANPQRALRVDCCTRQFRLIKVCDCPAPAARPVSATGHDCRSCYAYVLCCAEREHATCHAIYRGEDMQHASITTNSECTEALNCAS